MRAHLIWRDTVLELMQEEAVRLGTPREVVTGAVRAVRASSDAGLVQVARAFDKRMTNLALELEVEREALLHQVVHDALTGLPNRVLLYDRINQAVLAAKRGRTTFAPGDRPRRFQERQRQPRPSLWRRGPSNDLESPGAVSS